MLASSSLAEEYWDGAILTANYVRNMLPVKGLKVPPFEATHGKKHNAAHLRIFVSKWSTILPNAKRGENFFPVSTEGIFMVYDEQKTCLNHE